MKPKNLDEKHIMGDATEISKNFKTMRFIHSLL